MFLGCRQELSGVTGWHLEAHAILSRFGEQRVFWKLLTLYRVHCRWFNFVAPSLRATCAQRCAVLIAKLHSGWAVMAVFYGSTALAPGQPDCTPPEELLEKLVRSAVVSWISAVVGSLPFVALLAVVNLGGSRPQRIWTTLFWTFLMAFLLFCVLVICIFLASVSPADGERFLISCMVNLVTSLLFLPVWMTLLFGACLACKGENLQAMVAWPLAQKARLLSGIRVFLVRFLGTYFITAQPKMYILFAQG